MALWAGVAVALLALGFGWFYFARLQSRTASPLPQVGSEPGRRSGPSAAGRIEWLAVLPLRNLTGDTNQEFFVEGITDLLTTELSHISGLQVKSFTTALTYQGSRKAASEIGRELKVDTLVEGSVQRDADQIILNVQLIDAANDRHLWSKQFKRAFEDVWKVKAELAEVIAGEIQVTLSPQEQQRLSATQTRKPEAVEDYLKGRHFLNRQTLEDFRAATNCFQRALEIEASWADAYAGMAQAYLTISSAFRAPREAMPLARSNAIQALHFDDNLAEAHYQLGDVKLLFDYEFREAEPHFQRALALNRNFAAAHDGYALFLQSQGKHAQAIAEDELAYRLDPLSALIGMDYVGTLLIARQYDRAIEQGMQILAFQKDNHMAAAYIALAYAQSQRARLGIELLEPRCTLKERPPMALAALGYCYACAGQLDLARQTAAQVERIATEQYVCVYEIATIYAALGDADTAFRWLDKAFEARADCIPFTKEDPRLDRLHSDPRFDRLLRMIGFTPRVP
jgi:TolB-like protein